MLPSVLDSLLSVCREARATLHIFCPGYLSALKVAVWGTQWARLQLAAEYGW
ncbi:MAG: hypothetical protein RSC54_25440 [Pseudomonas sp.]|uniref:hypothetical protein n=1 Tax=Pseudomonas sp. TaxID=306 RepID=UPI002FCA992D